MTQEQYNNLMACKVIALRLFNDVSEIETDLKGSDCELHLPFRVDVVHMKMKNAF